MYWQFHVTRLAVLGRLPLQDQLRRFKRRFFGYEPDPGNLRGTIYDFNDMELELRRTGRSFEGATVLEIGTGWFPTVPIALCMRGARRVIMTDLNKHLDDVTFASTVAFLRREGGDFSKLPDGCTINDFPLTYLAPFDVDQVPAGSIDVVISRTVLEHIAEDRIRSLFRSLRPKLSENGVMLHCVDHSDHLEHKDNRLSKLNFLTWSDYQHSLVNRLSGEGENRLRHSDYLRLLGETGYRVIMEKGDVHAETELRLRGMKLSERFQGRPSTELATLRSVYIASPS